MKKIFIAVLIIILIVGAFAFFRFKQNHQTNIPATSTTDTLPTGGKTEPFVPGTASTAEQITVNAGTSLGQMRPDIGLVHGVTYEPTKYNYDKTIELISALKPHFWRSSNFDNNVFGFVEKGDFVKKDNTQLMFVMQDAMHVKYGFDIKIGSGCLNGKFPCFASFAEFKDAWIAVETAVMNQIVKNKYPINHFEVFGEPINAGFGKLNSGSSITGITPEQLMDLYKTTDAIIRAEKPDALVGGPGWISYDKEVLTTFLDYIVQQKLSLDFLSWHEFGTPEEMAAHVADARNLISARPQLCNPKCPEIRITEFSPSEQIHVPSTGLAWFYYLDKAGVDGASSACWDVVNPDGSKGDTCWATFNGMFMQDNVTTTDMYWVYKMYADMDNMRVRTDITKPHTVAISDRNDSQKELKVMVGRYGYKGVAGDVKINVKDYPFGNGKVSAEIWKVPANGVLYHQTALASQIQVDTQHISVNNGEITLNIGAFKDGEVYYVLFKPI